MKLVIISHTEHYISSDGELVGWGPTIREIDHLTQIFELIYHCAPLHKDKAPQSAIPYKMKDSIRFVPISPSGGESLWAKVSVLKTAPANLRIVRSVLKEGDVYQFRAPTGIGLYMIPWLKWFSGKPGWFKYAGNWMQENPPAGYRIQRAMLRNFSGQQVTINGKWPNQKKHCVTFENPCLTEEEIKEGRTVFEKKDYSGSLTFCFVGRLESAKGVGHILSALKKIGFHNRIAGIHFVGDGPEKEVFVEQSKGIEISVFFHGFMSRDKVGEILEKSHVFLLPSASEGFPKVVAEAANYGCIPLVSNVSSLGQYIFDGKNGYIVDYDEKIADELANRILKIVSEPQLREIAFEANRLSPKFSFDYYNERLKQEIINPLGLNPNSNNKYNLL
ncbi:glycosyltransferase [Marinilabilia salmonicolor]|uniref:glycosyltransferase n=1 Tax=Marinilabilia salmonicolor TaxID=989 RepID=UPI00029A56EE|nr:glycosyltransferase [Marinilabilia salmonicolor]